MLKDIVGVTSSWWWRMPPDRLRAALALLELVRISDGALVTEIATLSRVLAIDRRLLDRAIEELETLGLIHRESTRGRGGFTKLSAGNVCAFETHLTARLNDQSTSGNSEGKTETSARGAHFPVNAHAHLPDPSDLDLSNPPIRIPISSPSEDLLPPDRSPTSPPDINHLEPPDPAIMETTDHPQGTAPPKKRRAPKPLNTARIPVVAWRLADRFRQRLLERDPKIAIARYPWDTSKQVGTRAQWAEQFRLMLERDKRTVDEIGEVVRWLFESEHLFVIQSPASLIEKFDRVRAAMTNASKATRGGNPADNRPTPKFTSWSDK